MLGQGGAGIRISRGRWALLRAALLGTLGAVLLAPVAAPGYFHQYDESGAGSSDNIGVWATSNSDATANKNGHLFVETRASASPLVPLTVGPIGISQGTAQAQAWVAERFDDFELSSSGQYRVTADLYLTDLVATASDAYYYTNSRIFAQLYVYSYWCYYYYPGWQCTTDTAFDNAFIACAPEGYDGNACPDSNLEAPWGVTLSTTVDYQSYFDGYIYARLTLYSYSNASSYGSTRGKAVGDVTSIQASWTPSQ